MKTFIQSLILLCALFLSGCDKDSLMPSDAELQSTLDKTDSENTEAPLKATGEVLVTYIANPGGHNDNMENDLLEQEGVTRFALVAFDAHEAGLNKSAKGNLLIAIQDINGLIKREFKGTVVDAIVYPLTSDAWFLAVIESDIRHNEGHNGDDEVHGDTSSGNGQMNGASNGQNHDADTHEEDEHGGGCGSGDEDHGNKSRVGDLIEVRVHDGGTPGTNGDLIKWKWHVSNSSHAPSADGQSLWEEMCDKEIIEGNLVVHIK